MVDPDTLLPGPLPANLRTIVTVYPSNTFRIDWDLLKWHALVTRGMWIQRVCEETCVFISQYTPFILDALHRPSASFSCVDRVHLPAP
ncbi:hypothetical protein M404DRAFT_1002220 [Pisolithus tinctorius Marx 270]|uniref:Uncharacterized protein n=1 Tax=Pisolithus tinctorius Marx 270 TaxID=870435 RepID=A0A0C3JYY0_PISTI|nr:hypothetical protein M404DRAFT_1002220 [Pisolithus tinctorius Marx 270]